MVNAHDYDREIREMDAHQNSPTLTTRFDLAIAAFEHTAAYDGMIANHFGTMVPSYGDNKEGDEESKFQRTFNAQFIKSKICVTVKTATKQPLSMWKPTYKKPQSQPRAKFKVKLSYNNIADTDAALECVKEFSQPACVIVKHANPCGVALADDLLQPYNRAYQTDQTSAFGGIKTCNRELDGETAKAIIERQFVEVIIAPKVSQAAIDVVSAKQNVCLLEGGEWQGQTTGFDLKFVNGGLLVQDRDQDMMAQDDLQVVSTRQTSEDELKDALFCWKAAKYVKSNAIVYAKGDMTIGIGAGQMSRVYSTKIAGIKAADEGFKSRVA